MLQLKADFESDWRSELRRRLTATWGPEVAGIKDGDIPIYYFESLLRIIVRQPRKLRIASDFRCPPQDQEGWKVLQQKVITGEDLNAHLSTHHGSLLNFDGLLAEWGVHHFHLGTGLHPSNPRYVDRSGSLVFALLDDQAFYAINVYRHGDWERSSILERLHANWPNKIRKYRLNHVAGEDLQEGERRAVRKKRLQAAFRTSDGTVYGSLGGPFSRSGVKMESVRNADIWAAQIRALQTSLEDRLNELLPIFKQRGYNNEVLVEAELNITGEGYAAFFPKYRVRATLLLAEES
jgi:hypothetical protein